MCETTSMAECVCKYQVVADTRKQTVVELKQLEAFRLAQACCRRFLCGISSGLGVPAGVGEVNMSERGVTRYKEEEKGVLVGGYAWQHHDGG